MEDAYVKCMYGPHTIWIGISPLKFMEEGETPTIELEPIKTVSAVNMVQQHIRSYENTLAIMQGELPNTARLLRLEKSSSLDTQTNIWTLTFYALHDPIVKTVTSEIKGKLNLSGDEVYSECPYMELLTKVRVFL